MFKTVIRHQKQGAKQEGKGRCSKDTAAAKGDSDFKVVSTKSLFAYLFLPGLKPVTRNRQVSKGTSLDSARWLVR